MTRPGKWWWNLHKLIYKDISLLNKDELSNILESITVENVHQIQKERFDDDLRNRGHICEIHLESYSVQILWKCIIDKIQGNIYILSWKYLILWEFMTG